MNITKQDFKKHQNLLISIGATTLSALAIYAYYFHGLMYPSTENAYVSANLINVSPKVGGYIQSVYVHNNQHVKKGDLLLRINPIDYTLELQKSNEAFASAELDASIAKQQIQNSLSTEAKAKSDYRFAHQMAQRYTRLYQAKAGSLQDMQKYSNQANQARQALDEAASSLKQANTHYAIAKTRILSAKLMVKNAKVNKDYTKLLSPVDGYVSNLNLQTGQLVMAGQKLFGLIDNSRWWLDVNLKETQLSRIKVNQSADIKLDMYKHHYKGKVESISYASGSTFSLLPAENASGNWVKVTQYFTVRVAVHNDAQYPLRVGASAEVQINTRSK